mmetsp:Transcript_20835/g.45356  ORF Transcript_20835/g.45356 Transcript_20835/m.45356 type:complete len:324 (+) Transcript_20835:689-1660(+)
MFGFDHFFLAHGGVLGNNGLEIINVVDLCVRNVLAILANISWNGNIHKHNRASTRKPVRFHLFLVDDVIRARSSGVNNVRSSNNIPEVVHQFDFDIHIGELFRQLLGPWQGTIDNGDFFESARRQVGHQQTGHRTGSDYGQTRFGKGEIEVWLGKHFGEFHRRRRNTDGSFGDASFGSNPLSGGNGVVQESRENLSTTAILFDGVQMALTNLGQNLSLSHNQGIQTTGHSHNVPDGVFSGKHEQVFSEFSNGKTGSLGQKLGNTGHGGPGIGSGVIDFETIAGTQDGGFDNVSAAANLVRCGVPVAFGNGKLFTNLDIGVVNG